MSRNGTFSQVRTLYLSRIPIKESELTNELLLTEDTPSPCPSVGDQRGEAQHFALSPPLESSFLALHLSLNSRLSRFTTIRIRSSIRYLKHGEVDTLIVSIVSRFNDIQVSASFGFSDSPRRISMTRCGRIDVQETAR